ncbi:MAG: tetratricopeptide repeat protein [Candidatus Moraniibacteriota bacterium]
MPKKIAKMGYRKKTETDPLVRASAALKRLRVEAGKMDEKNLPEIKEKFSDILQVAIDELNKGIEPTVKCLKLCVQLKDEKSVLKVFNLSHTPDKEKIRRFIQKVEGFTRGERLYLHGVLRRHAAYFDGTLDAKMQALQESGKHRAGLALVREWLAKIVEDDVLLARESLHLSGLGRHLEAIASLDQAIALDASISAWWVFRGNAYAALGEYEQAIRDYSISLALDPENWAVSDKIGHGYFFLGQTERGIGWTEQAFERGRQPDTALILSSMLERCGRIDEALARTRAWIREFPGDERFRERLQELKRIPPSREDSKRKPEK